MNPKNQDSVFRKSDKEIEEAMLMFYNCMDNDLDIGPLFNPATKSAFDKAHSMAEWISNQICYLPHIRSSVPHTNELRSLIATTNQWITYGITKAGGIDLADDSPLRPMAYLHKFEKKTSNSSIKKNIYRSYFLISFLHLVDFHRVLCLLRRESKHRLEQSPKDFEAADYWQSNFIEALNINDHLLLALEAFAQGYGKFPDHALEEEIWSLKNQNTRLKKQAQQEKNNKKAMKDHNSHSSKEAFDTWVERVKIIDDYCTSKNNELGERFRKMVAYDELADKYRWTQKGDASKLLTHVEISKKYNEYSKYLKAFKKAQELEAERPNLKIEELLRRAKIKEVKEKHITLYVHYCVQSQKGKY